jgi:hypothetical protein
MMKYDNTYNIEKVDIMDSKKMLFYSDGLNEAEMKEDKDYSKVLEEDFLTSHSKSEFLSKVKDNIENIRDDIALFYIQNIYEEPLEKKVYTIETKMSEIDNTFEDILKFLYSIGVSEEFEVEYHNSFTEMVMNAYEHGNFNLTYKLKHELIANDEYIDFLQQKEAELGESKEIEIKLSYYQGGDRKFLMTQITDSGEGFDTLILRNKLLGKDRFHGRGIVMTKNYVDGLYYNMRSNSVLMTKNIY